MSLHAHSLRPGQHSWSLATHRVLGLGPRPCISLVPRGPSPAHAIPSSAAVVSTLVGRPKLLPARERGEECSVVPLLLPSEHRLPFAMTLEIASWDGRDGSAEAAPAASQDNHHDASMQQGVSGASGSMSTSKTMTTTQLSAAADAADQGGADTGRVLELLYVLSGEGTCRSTEKGGSQWHLKAGDSVLAWANTTRISCQPLEAPAQSGSQGSPPAAPPPQERRLAALKFHLPLGLVQRANPGAVPAGLPADVPDRAGNPSPPGSLSLPQELVERHLLTSYGPRLLPHMSMSSSDEEDLLPSISCSSTAQALSMGSLPHPAAAALAVNAAGLGLSGVLTDAECSGIMASVQLRTQQAVSQIVAASEAREIDAAAAAAQQRPLAAVVMAAVTGVALDAAAATAATAAGVPPELAFAAAAGVRAAPGGSSSGARGVRDRFSLALSSLDDAVGSARSAIHTVASFWHGSGSQQWMLAGPGAMLKQQELLQHQRSAGGADLMTSASVVMQRAMEDFIAYRFPRQTNTLAFFFDPSELLDLSLSFGIEVFEPNHHTPIHVHPGAHELFFVLAGTGDAYSNGHHARVGPGDVLVFPPGSRHGLDNNSSEKLYCLQLMAPNEAFIEYVMTGTNIGRLTDEDLCKITNRHC